MIIEHRKFMRIDDRLVVSWRPAESTQLAAEDLREVMLLSVNRQINDMIASLAGSSPEVARVLLQLNHKVDLLTDETNQSIHGPSLTRVNISRSGAAFEWHSNVQPGTTIRFTVALPPENIKVTVVAEVLAADPTDSDDRVKVRCRFLDEQPEKVEAIQRYIDHCQEMREERNRLLAPSAKDELEKPAINVDHASVLHYR